MQAGRLDRLIRLDRAERPFDVDATTGEPAPSYSELLTCWAERRPVRGSEQLAAGQTAARVEYEFRIRFPRALGGDAFDSEAFDSDAFDCDAERPTPDESWRLVDLGDSSRVYDLVRVDEIGRREGLLITATARAE